MHPHPPTSAIVLAGGRSRRLGYDKRYLRLWGAAGPTLLEHVVQVVGKLCAEVIVVLNDADNWGHISVRRVPDIYADGGALGGLYAGLCAASHPYALVVACDMPFLNPALLGAMLAQPRNYDALVPQALAAGTTRNLLGAETLHAIYGRSCLKPIQATLESGNRQIAAFFPQVRVTFFAASDTQRYDPAGRSFININTPEQAAAATEWFARPG